MEGAYTELYQEFLRLQSLCLKQAALLQQLTEALQRHQGGGQGDMGPIPVQCTQARTQALTEVPAGAQLAPGQNHTAHHCLRPSDVVDSHTELLTGDVGRLHLNGPSNASASPPSYRFRDTKQADPLLNHDPAQMFSKPRVCGSYLDSEFLSQPGGFLMSDLTMQSQVCEFCHAVFPRHTTTRGQFLRHLHTHIP